MDGPEFWLPGFPLPPSINAQLLSSGGRHRKTSEARVFDRAIDLLRIRREKGFREIREVLSPFLKDHTLRIDLFVVLHHSRVFTKPNPKKPPAAWVKCIDHLNFDKSAKDALSKCLGIDDKFFFAGECEKIFCEQKADEQIIFRISLHHPRSLKDIRERMMAEQD